MGERFSLPRYSSRLESCRQAQPEVLVGFGEMALAAELRCRRGLIRERSTGIDVALIEGIDVVRSVDEEVRLEGASGGSGSSCSLKADALVNVHDVLVVAGRAGDEQLGRISVA